MSDITFTNTRFDPDLVEFHGIAKVAHLASWGESTFFTEAEQAATPVPDA
jgi:hypothetical protein